MIEHPRARRPQLGALQHFEQRHSADARDERVFVIDQIGDRPRDDGDAVRVNVRVVGFEAMDPERGREQSLIGDV